MKKDLLIIGFVWPEPDSTAAGSRMLQLIEVFQKNNIQVSFVSSAAKTEKSFCLEELNIQTHKIQLNNSSFDTLVKKIDPDIVLFDRFLTEEQYGWRIAEICPDALRILDTEDLHFLRNARLQAFKDKESVDLKYLVNDIAKREIASIYRSDLSLIISEYEFELLSSTFKIDPQILAYIPFLLDKIKENALSSYPLFENRSGFMSIGNFRHEPNWNAVLHLKNTIWPEIRKQISDVDLYIYGAYVTDKVKQLHNKKAGFIIKGWEKKAGDIYKKHRVCLAPLQFGAGLKGKLIDAMRYGTPSVTTHIGAEAMHGNLDWNGFITDNVENFANRSVLLYKNPEVWSKAQQNGVSIINKCFDKKIYGNHLIKKIASLQNNLKNHRLKNFTGSLLLHHTLKSTKYLSKWIEEKNKV